MHAYTMENFLAASTFVNQPKSQADFLINKQQAWRLYLNIRKLLSPLYLLFKSRQKKLNLSLCCMNVPTTNQFWICPLTRVSKTHSASRNVLLNKKQLYLKVLQYCLLLHPLRSSSFYRVSNLLVSSQHTILVQVVQVDFISCY